METNFFFWKLQIINYALVCTIRVQFLALELNILIIS